MPRTPRMHLPARQRGLALLVLLVLFATTAAYMLVSSLNQGSVAMTLARSDRNRAVMQEAKAALIAWAASETLQGATFQPGALPCPNRNNDGYAKSTCSSGVDQLGRLPYKTLGIADLRDANGERLWYAVSSNFRRSTSNVINSDTQGQLSISGLTPASNVIAIVLAPGARLGTQDRSPDEAACTANNDSSQPCNTAVNYLEGINGDTNAADYVTATENLIDPVAANLFNDQLLVITQQDLFAVVEPVVAARIERDIVRQYIYDASDTSTGTQWSDVAGPNKSRYFNAWGAFPFAATFADPGSSSFTGTAGTYEGLLPVVDLTYSWSLFTVSAFQTGGSGSVSSVDCSATSSANLTCNISYDSGAPTIRMSGTVNDVGRSFVQLTRLSDVNCTGSTGCTLSAKSVSGSVNSAGVGTVTFDATLPSSSPAKTVTITIGSLISSPLISSTDGFAGWFNRNEWHKLSYYAVSPSYAPGGLPGVPPPCYNPANLSVANLAAPYANPATNIQTILILGGRSLSGATRPNATLTDYLEAKNAITCDNVFEHSLGKTTTVASAPVAINDRVIVIAP